MSLFEISWSSFGMHKPFDNFDILGHIDLIRRYGCYDDKTLKLDDFKDRVDAILKALVEKGKGLEVNTSGFRYNLDSPMPDYEIIKGTES